MDEEKAIILGEISRLERAWREAQERYGVTGSRSSERTMRKYSVLIRALERALSDIEREEDDGK